MYWPGSVGYYKKNGYVPTEFQHDSVDSICWLGTLDSEQFKHKSLDWGIGEMSKLY